ncbi:MAG: PAS domain S-box protein, partial [Bacteroidota bacterium]|nr:PAS domain S-box protein [Bacteroidota bacterium]
MQTPDVSLHILLVEDDLDQVQFLRTTLRIGTGSPYALTHAASLADAAGLLETVNPDIILLDLDLPDSRGIDTARAMLEQAREFPVVIFSGNADVNVALEAVRLGAQDYLLKGEAREPLFSRAIVYAIERKRVSMQLEQAQRALEERNAALEAARGELRAERDMFIAGPTVLFRRALAPGFPMIHVSRNVSQFGFVPAELATGARRFDELVHDDDRDAFTAFLTSRLAGGDGSVEHEYRIRDARGETVWLHEVTRLQRDATGTAVAQLAYVVDITRRRQAEQGLSTARRRVEDILDGIEEIIFDLDRDGTVLFVSPAVERLLGHTATDLIGRPFSELIVDTLRGEWAATLRRMFDGELSTCEFPVTARDGGEHVLHIAARRRYEDGEVRGLAGIMTDITDRRAMEHAIRDVRMQTQQYLDIAEVIFLSLDLDGRIALVNNKGCEILGYREHEIIGRDWFATCLPDSAAAEVREYFRRMLREGEKPAETHENVVVTKGGEHRLIRWHNALLHDARGSVVGVLSSGEDITERRRIEEEVRGTRELIELALWGADLGAWEWNVATDALTLNRRSLELLGFVDDDQLPSFGDLREEILPAEDRIRLRAALDEHLAGETPFYQAETWMITRSGEWKWVLERGKVVERDKTGAPLRLAGTYLDLTERKYAEIALEDSEKKFRLLAENSSDIIWTANADLELTFISPSVEHVLGYTPDEIMRMELFDVVADRVRPTAQEYFTGQLQEIVDGRSPLRPLRDELPLRRKDGGTLWAEIVATPLFDHTGRLVSIHGNTRDIHHRKLAQLALAEREEKYRLLVQNQTDLVIKIDLDGKLLFVSPSYCRMFGKSEEEILGQTFFPTVHEDDRLAALEAMKKLLEPPHTSYSEQRALTRDGWRWLGWLDTAVLDERGEVTAIIGVGRDVTERRMAERAMIESERRLRTVVSNLPVIMFTIDADGVFTLSEGMGLESLGLRAGQVVGASVFDVYADY